MLGCWKPKPKELVKKGSEEVVFGRTGTTYAWLGTYVRDTKDSEKNSFSQHLHLHWSICQEPMQGIFKNILISLLPKGFYYPIFVGNHIDILLSIQYLCRCLYSSGGQELSPRCSNHHRKCLRKWSFQIGIPWWSWKLLGMSKKYISIWMFLRARKKTRVVQWLYRYLIY